MEHGLFVAIYLEKLDPFDERFMCGCLKGAFYFVVGGQLGLVLEVGFAGLVFCSLKGVVNGVLDWLASRFEGSGWTR